MLSLPDMAILGVLALLVFGEQKLPGIMRQAGRVMREVQNTSQSFIREMEHAADVNEPPKPPPPHVEEPPAEEPPAEEPQAGAPVAAPAEPPPEAAKDEAPS